MVMTIMALVAVGALGLAVSGIIYLFARAIAGLPLAKGPEGG
jgi:hypothetical protein